MLLEKGNALGKGEYFWKRGMIWKRGELLEKKNALEKSNAVEKGEKNIEEKKLGNKSPLVEKSNNNKAMFRTA